MICLSENGVWEAKIMYKLLVIITCIVVLTIHWNDFTEIINLAKILEIGHNVITEVKE